MSDELLLQQMAASIAKLQEDVTAIRETLAEKRGERRVALWVAGIAGGLVGGLVRILLK